MQPEAPIEAYEERPSVATEFRIDTLHRLCDQGCRFVWLTPRGWPVTKGWPDKPKPSAQATFLHLGYGGRIGYEPASLSMAVIDMDGDGAGDPPATLSQRNHGCALIRKQYGDPIAELLSGSGHTTGRRHMIYRVAGSAPIGRKPDGSPVMQANHSMYADRQGPGSGTRFDLKWIHGYCAIPRQDYLDALATAAETDAKPALLVGAVKWGQRHRIKGYRPRRQRIVQTADLPPLHDPDAHRFDWHEWSAKRIQDLQAVAHEGNRHDSVNREAFVAGLVSSRCPSHIDAVRSAARSAGLDPYRISKATNDAYAKGKASAA